MINVHICDVLAKNLKIKSQLASYLNEIYPNVYFNSLSTYSIVSFFVLEMNFGKKVLSNIVLENTFESDILQASIYTVVSI